MRWILVCFPSFVPLVCSDICAESVSRLCSGKDAESWAVLSRQAALLLLTSVAHYPMFVFFPSGVLRHLLNPPLFRSQHAVSHLNVLNTLLQPQSPVLGYLLDRQFYSLVAQAINSVVSHRRKTYHIGADPAVSLWNSNLHPHFHYLYSSLWPLCPLLRPTTLNSLRFCHHYFSIFFPYIYSRIACPFHRSVSLRLGCHGTNSLLCVHTLAPWHNR